MDKFKMKKVGMGTIQSVLKKINFSHKRAKLVITQRNLQRILNERAEKSKIMVQYLKEQFDFVYIDETAIDERLHVFSGYSRK